MPMLTGRVAVVTGSARNIGRATALRLAREGAAVMVHARRDADGVAETVDLLTAAGAKADSHLADLSTEEGAAGLIAATIAAFGRLDILVNNAAVRRNTPLTEMSFAEWREVLGASLDASFLATRAAVPHMIPGKWGRIVNLGGISMFIGLAGRAHVSAAKAGMIGMTRSLASELGPHGITVNVVAPGAIATERGAAAGARPSGTLSAGVPVGRDGFPEEIAHIVTMLCGPDAAYTTGQTIEVNGGRHYS
ncbi:MAG: SDR family NAD(P)-dependent oxidoreductase [Hyphomicrobiaceae bacterium]